MKTPVLLFAFGLFCSALSSHVSADRSTITIETATIEVDFKHLVSESTNSTNEVNQQQPQHQIHKIELNELDHDENQRNHLTDPVSTQKASPTYSWSSNVVENNETREVFPTTSTNTRTSRELQTGNEVVRIQAVNTKTSSIIIDNLMNGQIISLDTYGLTTEDDLNFIIVAGSGTLSVAMDTKFRINFRIENSLPFTLCRDSKGVYFRCTKNTSVRLGSNSITATPYSQTNATGTKGPAFTVAFSIVLSGGGGPAPTPPTPTPIAPVPIAPTPTAPTPIAPVPIAPTPIAPTPIAPTPIAPTPITPTPIAPTTIAPTPIAPTPIAPVPTAPNVVTKIQLVSATTDQILVDSVQNNAIIKAGDVNVANITELAFVAVTESGTQSVVFDFNGSLRYSIDSGKPYAMCGDFNGDIAGCSTLKIGTNIITATPYSLIGGTGTAGPALALTVEMSNEGATSGTHLAHAVAAGPYVGTITDSSNVANVKLDGQTSHTHGIGLDLNSVEWKEGTKILGTSAILTVPFTAGLHNVSITVKDTGNNIDTEFTTVDVKNLGFPAITSLSPNNGSLNGGNSVTIKGSSFSHPAADVTVMFGQIKANDFIIQDDNTIVVTVPASSLPVPVSVTVTTPVGMSTDFIYSYTGSIPIVWENTSFLSQLEPTVGRFGPDEKLYVGNRRGILLKISMNADFTASTNVISKIIVSNQAITGLTFDPMDPDPTNPCVFFTANPFFHKGELSTSGTSVGGRIMKACGPVLDTLTTVISGLPVSDLDHGLNGMEFGDKGELYFTSGSNTNGGIPGPLSSSQKLKENFLSAAVNVAYLSAPGFNGSIKWSALDDGNMIASGIDVFAMGLRNPYSVLQHSNGNLYASDNGPNPPYGRMMTDCNGNSIGGVKGNDEFLLLEKGAYMGHPNPKRASYFNDPRQCIYVNATESGPAGYTKPLLTFSSSRDGMVEFRSNHFGGQLRGQIFIAHHRKIPSLGRIILNEAGTDIVAESKQLLIMDVGSSALDLCMAPNGNVIEMRYGENALGLLKPVEPATILMVIHTCFPARGKDGGGNTLSIYGVNFGSGATVSVGGKDCPVTSTSSEKVTCTLPGGSGTVDVEISLNGSSSTFTKGYRYISGVQPPGFVLPVYN